MLFKLDRVRSDTTCKNTLFLHSVNTLQQNYSYFCNPLRSRSNKPEVLYCKNCAKKLLRLLGTGCLDVDMMEPIEVLEKYWGYSSFRPKQEEIVNTALSGRDVLAILPTGGGKSVCFQVPAMIKPGIAIVVTPLIALMKDQVQNLNDRGIKALAVYMGMSRREIDLALNNAAFGDFKFLYISPERLSTKIFRDYFCQMEVSFIVVDEAHCISQWGYDFRPDYLKIAEIRKMTDAPVIALTATATPEVADDIMEKLAFDEKTVLKTGFERPNLSYIVREREDKLGQLKNICQAVSGTGIVYVRSRKKTEELSAFLNSTGVKASFYHAGLSHQLRMSRQEKWKADEIRVMVCTNAFGMGIDKPDVRFVVHFDLPDCPEAYFQEAGRGGRDGRRSYAVLLWNKNDLRRMKQIATVSFPDIEYIEEIYHKVHYFCNVPFEYGMGRELKFDFLKFCREFKLNSSSAYYAIRYIEREGHWVFSEDTDIPTKVQIMVDRRSLYDIELSDRKMYDVLEAMMRSYTGLFSFPVLIDEDYIASKCGVKVPDLRQLLYRLSLEHVIKYIPADHATVIYLKENRLRPKNVRLSPQRLQGLKDTWQKRADAMVGYVTEDDECRSRYLLRYFGQDKSEDCGNCDVCRKHPSEKDSDDTRKRIYSYISDRDGDYTLNDITLQFGARPDSGSSDYLHILRRMIDDGGVPPYRAD